ncbi:MAG: DUF881 domain-containing protein [Fimbriimonadaceae bacterium]|nr:DUF881 domain-containing protein [Fimbriimonadaceae bacterium]
MNPFVSKVNRNPWMIPVSILSLLLGFMMMSAWLTEQSRGSRIPLLDPSQQSRIRAGTIDMQADYQKVAAEVEKLRKEKTQLENAMGDNTKMTKVLNENLQDIKNFAGLTEVEGPGVTVTLRDNASPNSALGAVPDDIIHDQDVTMVVNELWAGGAEALSVNNRRIVARSSFTCVGNTILVDNVRIAPPVRIRAIGDPDLLIGALNTPGRVIDTIRQSSANMVQIEKVEKHSLPAYNGPTATKFATVVKAEDSK